MKHTNYINLGMAVAGAVVVVYAFSQTYWRSDSRTVRLELPEIADAPVPTSLQEPEQASQPPAPARTTGRTLNSNFLRNRALPPEDLPEDQEAVTEEQASAESDPAVDFPTDPGAEEEGGASMVVGVPSSGGRSVGDRSGPIRVGGAVSERRDEDSPRRTFQPGFGRTISQPEAGESEQSPVTSEPESRPSTPAPPPGRRQSPPPPPTRASTP